MDLSHSFTVPTPVDATWAHFQDLGALAECFPGATIGDYDEQNFSGTVKVKLGPIALVYSGSGTFVEKDDEAHRFVVDAKGKDKRGNGTAGADVLAQLSDVGSGSTRVEVTTDLNITGKPAQFGRGVMQDVSDKLLGQFTACLEQKVGAPAGPVTEPEPPAGAADPAPATGGDADRHTEERAGSIRSVLSDLDDGGPPGTPGDPGVAAPAVRPPTAAAGNGAGGGDDALDLGATVLPVLAKLYWKQGLGALLVLWILARLLGRRS